MITQSPMPPAWTEIAARTATLGFDMPSEPRTGALLRMLAASKPGGRLLELGTGTGLATSCLLAGMDAAARLVSVDIDERVQGLARGVLGGDPRVRFVLADGIDYIGQAAPASFDLIFADAWPGKYEGVDAALTLLRPGGLYIGDDMLPQPNWSENHQPRVDELVHLLKGRPDLTTASLDWGSGFVIAAKNARSA